MAITDIQRNNIQKLSFTDASEAFDELVERLGIVSQQDYIIITAYEKTRQNLRLDMISGEIPSKKIGKIRFPMINKD